MGLSLHTSFPSPSSDHSTSSPLSSSTSTTGGWNWGFTNNPSSHNHYHYNNNNNNNNHAVSPTSTSGYSSSSSPSPTSQTRSRSRSQSQNQSLPSRFASTLRRSSLALLLRRRPSKIDLALSEERSRADGDAVERQGLGLMEPRPVDPMTTMVGIEDVSEAAMSSSRSRSGRLSQPVFVMGGIEEVMEGKA